MANETDRIIPGVKISFTPGKDNGLLLPELDGFCFEGKKLLTPQPPVTFRKSGALYVPEKLEKNEVLHTVISPQLNVRRDHPDLRAKWSGKGEKVRFLYEGNHTVQELLDAKAHRNMQVTIIIPAKNHSEGVAQTLQEFSRLQETGLIDNLLVIDADTDNGATRRVVTDYPNVQYLSEKEAVRYFVERTGGRIDGKEFNEEGRSGKGTALAAATAIYSSEKDIILFCDADIHMKDYQAIAVLDPLLSDEKKKFVFPFFDRYTQEGGSGQLRKGARVTELVGKIYPQIAILLEDIGLGHIFEPLGGFYGGVGSEFAQFEFPSKYGVEVALLISALYDQFQSETRDESVVQFYAGTRVQQGQTTVDLAVMAAQIYIECMRQAMRRGKISMSLEEFERLHKGEIQQPLLYRDEEGALVYEIRRHLAAQTIYPPPVSLRKQMGWK